MPRLTVPVSERDHCDGPAEARITLVEYGDFECEHCGEAYPIVRRIQEHLGNELRLVWRHFPLSETHPHALHAAYAAQAAALQGQFWEMHHRLLENQDALEDPDLLAYARSLRLDAEKWKRDFTSNQIARAVEADFSSGVRSGVNGTPTFFINGVRHDGSYSYAALLDALEQQATPSPPSRRNKAQVHTKGK